MTVLADKLAVLIAASSPVDAALFRSCLVAMVEQMQEEPDMAALSLQGWRQWLDDEGYDVGAFVAILQQICRSSLETAESSDLQSHVLSIQAKPDGLPYLYQHLQDQYPDLASCLDDLQICAIEEQHALESRAGGLSKAAKTGIEVGAALYVAAGVTTLGVLVHKWRQANKKIKEFELQVRKVESAKKEIEQSLLRAEREAMGVERETMEELNRAPEKTQRELNRMAVHEGLLPGHIFSWEKHDSDVNEVFKALDLPGGARVVPIISDASGDEHWIIRTAERDMVRVVLDGKGGEEIIFYRSTGLAGKDQGQWPRDHWYAVPGMTPTREEVKGVEKIFNWINKYDETSHHYGSKKIEEIAKGLKAVSDKESLDTRLLFNELDQRESIMIRSINSKLVQGGYRGENQAETFHDLFRKLLPETLKERYPLTCNNIIKNSLDDLAKCFKDVGDAGILNHYTYWFEMDIKKIHGLAPKDENLLSKWKALQDKIKWIEYREKLAVEELKKTEGKIENKVNSEVREARRFAEEEEREIKRKIEREAESAKRVVDQKVEELQRQAKSDISAAERQTKDDIDRAGDLIDY